jgi:hypothetical protein
LRRIREFGLTAKEKKMDTRFTTLSPTSTLLETERSGLEGGNHWHRDEKLGEIRRKKMDSGRIIKKKNEEDELHRNISNILAVFSSTKHGT